MARENPCERCGFDTYSPESSQHVSERDCYQETYHAAIEAMKEKVAKAAEAVASKYGSDGTFEANRLVEAFNMFANSINGVKLTPLCINEVIRDRMRVHLSPRVRPDAYIEDAGRDPEDDPGYGEYVCKACGEGIDFE